MNKNKMILTALMALIMYTSEINAMKVEEAFDNIKTVKANILPFERTNDSREKTVVKLLSDFDSLLTQDLIYDLKAIKSYFNTGYDFGDEESNHKSLFNWIVYTRSLGALAKLGVPGEDIKLREELERAKRRLETIDFYTDDKDYKYCLSGIWSIVSTFDKEERKNFLQALKEGKEIPRDESLIKFFETSK